MSLSDQQFAFTKDVNLLLSFIFNRGWKVTIGEVERPEEMQEIYLQEGKSKTLDSLHLKKLAVDLNFFMPDSQGGFTYVGLFNKTEQKREVQIFGDFWESLSPQNEWGGNWKDFIDVPHFQRNEK